MRIVESFISAYESQYGKRPSEKAMRIMEWIAQTGEKLTALGLRHVEENRPKAPHRFFQHLASGINDPETAYSIAEYYQLCYEDGYAQGR